MQTEKKIIPWILLFPLVFATIVRHTHTLLSVLYRLDFSERIAGKRGNPVYVFTLSIILIIG